jgi:(2Fe-2S) ferredoxin
VVCRGGDCGNRTKHPDLDHAAQLRGIRIDLDGTADVVSSSCLDACEHSNVVVVLPGRDGRAAGIDPVWIGRANDPDTTADIISWVADGGPGAAAEPTLVAISSFRPSRLNRHELQEVTGIT